MYGIVNKAIESLVKENYGKDNWELIKKRSGVAVDYFVSNEPYDDSITYKLAIAVSDEMQIPLSKVLNAFGEYWVLKTGKEKYGSLMEAGGSTLREFLFNLPKFHNRIMLMYPKLTPPEFKITDLGDDCVLVHYYSTREGLQDFVEGLLSGLGKMYNTAIEVKLVESRSDGNSHDVFKVNWL